MGRNIWQSDYPVPMIKAVRTIVHKGATVKEAYDLFLKEKDKEKEKHRSSEPQKIISR
jgi:putative autoinducer-2 (AI-2) aldolase